VHFDPVIDGMYRAVAAGSAASAFLPDIGICGKTGTSQNPHGEDHSVFIAFAPRENPKIAIAVYVENSGYGGRYAAPIASLLIEKYLTGDIREYRKALEETMKNANLIYTKS
jgi:penicillin-binding protein 2